MTQYMEYVALALLLLSPALVVSARRGAAVGPGTGDPATVVRAFLAALDEGDAEGAMAMLAPDFSMRSWAGAVLVSREGYPDVLGWDLAAGGEREVERFEVDGDTVTLRIVERSRFTELLDLRPFRIETRYLVRDGAIAEQRFRELAPEGSAPYTVRFVEALRPVLAWAEKGAPALLAEATDGGAVRYDAPSARALLELVERHRKRQEER